jgi:hypothetical protein
MFTKTKIAFAAALILSAASAAMAGDSGENHQDNDRSARSVAQINPWAGQSANAGSAYGYTAAPTQKQRPARTQNQSR